MHLLHPASLIVPLVGLLVAASAPSGLAQNPELPKKGYQNLLDQGLLKGVIAAELIRPDLISVTVDGAFLPGATFAKVKEPLGTTAAEIQKPDSFVVTSTDDPAFASGIKPEAVYRTEYAWFNVKDTQSNWAAAAPGPVVRNDFFLKLPKPLTSGKTYTIEVLGGASNGPGQRAVTLAYDAAKTPTKVIKTNQIGYAASPGKRYAYLGWWAGDGGAVDYADFKKFEVVDNASGAKVLDGTITERRRDHVLSGEHVFEMDISALKPGEYRIVIPGFASSDPFPVGGDSMLEGFYHSARAFFHQRCGQELGAPYTAFAKPACHTEIWESGNFVSGPGAIDHNPGDRHAHANYTPAAGEKKMSFKGGYHDAADFDTFAYHLPTTAQMLMVYELSPSSFKDSQLNIPESGNGVPDLLDEALWGISFYLDHQLPNGGVPLGRANLCDARTQNIEGGKEAPLPPFGIIPPMRESTPNFAATAALLSRLIRPYDAKQADKLLEAAKKAFAYAEERGIRGIHDDNSTKEVPLVLALKKDSSALKYEDLFDARMVWAAGELLRATGDKSYSDYVVAHAKKGIYWEGFELALWPYILADPDKVDPATQEALKSTLLTHKPFGADRIAEQTEKGAYRMSNGDGTQCGWGNAQGINNAPRLILAHHLTKDPKYLDALSQNVDWHSGANPISQTFLTGMGTRFPNRPQISWFLYNDRTDAELYGDTVMGIPIYGFGPPIRTYPGNPDKTAGWPIWRSWRDIWGIFSEVYSEFTVHQTMGPNIMTRAYLYALDEQAGSTKADAKPKFPLGSKNPAPKPKTES